MKHWILVLLPLIGLGSLIAWRVRAKSLEAAQQIEQKQSRQKSPAIVSLAEVTEREMRSLFEAVGNVESPYNVRLAAKITGRIDFLEVREGDRVVKGQVLARLDASDLTGIIRQREAELAAAQSRLAQAQLVQNPSNVAVNAQMRQQEAAVASAEAELRQAQQNYQQLIAGSVANIADKQAVIDTAQAGIAHSDALIRSSEALLTNSIARYERMSTLVKQGFVAQQAADDSRTNVDVQRANVEVAKAQHNSTLAQLESAKAQKRSAEAQSKIGKNKGDTDIAAAAARLKQAKAALSYASANLAQQPAYKENLTALRSLVAAAAAALRSAESRREDTEIVAPFDSVVGERFSDPGGMATPGQTLLTLLTEGQIWIAAPAPEEAIAQVRVGQSAQVSFDALPNKKFTGRIVRVNPSADPGNRQFTLRVALANPQHQLKPGMFGRVRIESENAQQRVVVPPEAIQRNPKGENFVFVADETDTARMRLVTLGASDAMGVTVLSGLKPKERLIVLSAMPLKEGQQVKAGKVEGEKQETDKGETKKP